MKLGGKEKHKWQQGRVVGDMQQQGKVEHSPVGDKLEDKLEDKLVGGRLAVGEGILVEDMLVGDTAAVDIELQERVLSLVGMYANQSVYGDQQRNIKKETCLWGKYDLFI